MSYLKYYKEIDRGYIAFGGNPKGGKITSKGTIRTGKLDFDNVYFVKELKFNLFSVSQKCDKKNSVLFTDTECVVLPPDYKLPDENHVLFRIPRKNNMYSVDLKNIMAKEGLTFLFAKATSDKSRLWHRTLRHLNFKTMNKLIKGNPVTNIKEKDKIKAKTRQNHAGNGKRRKVNQVKDKVKVKPIKIGHDIGKSTKNRSRRHKLVCNPNKTPYSSQRAPQVCAKCGNPVDGHYCRHFALLRKKLKEVWFKICDEQIFFQEFLNTFESSNDDFNTPQEPIVFNQNPREDSSQSPPQIDHQCCYRCGDPLDGVFCGRCTRKSCRNGAYIGYNCPPKDPVISNPEPCHNQNIVELPQTLTNIHLTRYSGDENSSAHDSTPNFANDSPNIFHPSLQTPKNTYEFCRNDAHYSHDCPPQVPCINNSEPYCNQDLNNNPAFSSYDNDEDYTSAITPKEPDNSLSMGDEHLDIIPATESDEVINSSVEDLVSIPSESEGILDNTCDVPLRDNSPHLDVFKDQFEEFSDSNDDSTSIDNNYFFIDNIDYVEASPLDSELVNLKEVKDDNLREKLLNINLLIAKIKSLNDNTTPDHVLKSPSPFPIPVEDSNSFLEKSDTSLSYSDNSLPEFETFNHTEETNSGSTTTHADYSLPKYDSFLFEIEPDQGELTSIVILVEPRVHMPNVLTTHPILMLDLDFITSNNSLPESKIFYFDIEEKNSSSTTIHADISLPDLECFNFKKEPDPGELTSIVDSGIRETVLSVTNVNLPPEDDHSPFFAYVVWIFLSFLTYPVVPPYRLSFENEDTIFDPGISNYHFSSFMPVYLIGVELS
nr:ribonuclease H-like domain-containing protein [Tanacetum cinerariifolium]